MSDRLARGAEIADATPGLEHAQRDALAVRIAAALRERDEEIARLRAERDAARDLHERAMTAIHDAAGCRRDGLAAILAWIEDAREARDRIIPRLEARATECDEAAERWSREIDYRGQPVPDRATQVAMMRAEIHRAMAAVLREMVAELRGGGQ